MDQKELNSFIDQFVFKFAMSKTEDERKKLLNQLISLADKLDNRGLEKNAEKIDGLIKQAQFWNNLMMGLLGGGAATGVSEYLAGNLFTKEGITKLIRQALEAGHAQSAQAAGLHVRKRG